MKFSHNWLQEYIVETLPNANTIVDTLNAKAFEVEGTEERATSEGADYIYDIKILPNRTHDALGHAGVARELCACLDLTFKAERLAFNLPTPNSSVADVPVQVDDTKGCTRFMAVRIDGVEAIPSPEWLRNRLEAIGQKSINALVDITNYVQFTLNKPMHAYDSAQIDGGIVVRMAKAEEGLATLDDKELILNEKTLVIADHSKVLGLAGIKGGKSSGIIDSTRSIIIESANFNPVLIRKTAQKYNLHTDASKRFENGIANTLVEEALKMTVVEILKLFPSATIGNITDIYPRPDMPFKVGVSVDEVNDIVGATYAEEDVVGALKRLGFSFEKVIPKEKLESLIPLAIDKPYNRLASTLRDAPHNFSCGSLVNWMYVQAGFPSPRVAVDMFFFTRRVEKPDLRFGDYVFTNTLVQNPKNSMIYSQVLGREVPDVPVYDKTLEFLRGTKFNEGIDHVGIYIGDNKILHATSGVGKVVIEDMDKSDYFKEKCWYGRITDDLTVPQYVITIPAERLDLRIKEDIVEEIARIIGFETLIPTLPDLSSRKANKHRAYLNKKLHYQNLIRNILVQKGFSEVITYTFTQKGDVTLQKAASDKNKLRTNLTDGITEAIQKNIHLLPLIGATAVRIFEFGNCFTRDGEWTSLTIGIDDGKKKSGVTAELNAVLSEIATVCGVQVEDLKVVSQQKPYVVEINFDTLLSATEEPASDTFLEYAIAQDMKYVSFSQMPFIARDVAFWCGVETDKDALQKDIRDVAGELCISVTLFDEFTKEIEGKGVMKSLGFRLIYQDRERTLTDEEVNGYADKVYTMLQSKGYEIR